MPKSDTNSSFTMRCPSENGHLEIVKYLVSVGADFKDLNEGDHLKTIKYLVSIGADIRMTNNE